MKGAVYVYMVIMIVIAVFIFLYEIFSYPLALTSTMMTGMVNSTSDGTLKTNALGTFTIIETAWKYWPIFLLIGMVLWGLVASQRKEPLYDQY